MRTPELRSLLACAALLLATAAQAQDASPDAPVPTLKLSTQLVLLDASVLDRKSKARISDLTPADFLLVEEGVPQAVTYVSEDRLPLSLVFLFDATDSVQPVLKALAAGSKAVVAALGPQDEVAVMTFSNHATLVQEFTQDHALLEDALARSAKIHERNSTRLFQSMVEATLQMSKATVSNSRHVEVWLTDGTDQEPHEFAKKLRERDGLPAWKTEAEATDAVLHANVVIAGLVEPSWMTGFFAPSLVFTGAMGKASEIGVLTGGPFLKSSRKEVADKFALLLDTLRQRYTLGFKPSTARDPGTLCHLTLTLSPAFYQRHLTLKPSDVLIQTHQSYYR